MAEPVEPCPGGCRELADPEAAQRRVLELLPLCSPAFLGWLKVDVIGRIQREQRGTQPCGEVGKNAVSRV